MERGGAHLSSTRATEVATRSRNSTTLLDLRVHLPGGVVPQCGDHTNAGEFKLHAATLPERDHILPKPFRELCPPTTPGEMPPEPPQGARDAVW